MSGARTELELDVIADVDGKTRRWASDATLIDVPEPFTTSDWDDRVQHPHVIIDDDVADQLPPNPKSRPTTRVAIALDTHSPSAINTSSSHTNRTDLPIELWLEILLRTSDPFNLIMTCRALHDLSNSSTTMALFLLRRGPDVCGTMLRWRFFCGRVDEPREGRVGRVGWVWDQVGPCRNCNVSRRTITGNMIFSRASRLRFIFRISWRVVVADVITVTHRLIQSARRERYGSVRCARERRQLAIFRALVEFGFLDLCGGEAGGGGGEDLVAFAAYRSHLNLLSLLIDSGVGAVRRVCRRHAAFDEMTVLEMENDGSDDQPVEGNAGEVDAEESQSNRQTPPAWMKDGVLLLEAVRRRNFNLIKLLCGRGAALPEANGTRAFDLAALRMHIPELQTLHDHGAVASENLLMVVLRKALTAKLISCRTLTACSRRQRPIMQVLSLVMRSMRLPSHEFREIAAMYVTASLTELGDVRLLKTAHELGADLSLGNSAALFFSVVMGHHDVVRYLVREVRVPVAPLLIARRIAGIVFLLLLNATVMCWFLFDAVSAAAAGVCWATRGAHGSHRSVVFIQGACADVSGANILDDEYWLRTISVLAILGVTVGLAQRTMPVHGVVLGAYEIIRWWWMTRVMSRAR